MLSRVACSTHEFESCAHAKCDKWLEQVDSIVGDKMEAAKIFLNIVLCNDQRVITQDGKCYCVCLIQISGSIF